jgi:hypothetical protein
VKFDTPIWLQVVYRGASNSHLDQVDAASASLHDNISGGGGGNVMSMKKSAEIAAVFSGAKINQTTNIVDTYSDVNHLTPGQRRLQQNSFSDANLQSSLGYFP